MSVIGSNILAGASGQGGGYNLTKSLRFRSSASAYLNRTFGTPTSSQKFTWSGWIKRGKLDSSGLQGIFAPYSSGTVYGYLAWYQDGIRIYDRLSGGTNYLLQTTAVYRDPSAWYHLVYAVDTTQATAANRVRLYVNGVEVTAFSSSTYPTQNNSTTTNSAIAHNIGYDPSNTAYFDGYQGEINFVDGQQLTPSSFGETSTTTGVWIPKKYTGTYGTNGFYLKFTDTTSTSTLGTDFSGNSNTWTVNNISLTSGSTYDSMTDVPTLTDATTANYCVMSPVKKNSAVTLTDGNLAISSSSGAYPSFGTIVMDEVTGWYAEFLVVSNDGVAGPIIGVADASTNESTQQNMYVTKGVAYRRDGAVYKDNAFVIGSMTALTNGAILSVAYKAGKVWFAVNGTWQNSGNPSAGTGQCATASTPIDGYLFATNGYSGAQVVANFGQRPFSYTPPTGFVALNTFNLPTPTIGATASTQANDYFNPVLYTGTGSARSVTGVGFQPDFVWIKNRGASASHGLNDAVRGAGKFLYSNDTSAEGNFPTDFASFDSDGFSLGTATGSVTNTNGVAYVAWNWKANGAGSSNTAGTITSTVSANASAGFSVVTYTGTGSAATVGHGLGVAPSMLIGRSRTNSGYNWGVWHKSLQTIYGNSAWLRLNTTDAYDTTYDVFNPENNTSSVIGLGSEATCNQSGSNYVMYAFAEVAGYSKFGSYTGNGSADGTFVFTGFRPRFLIVKRTNDIGSWIMTDSARSTYNVTGELFNANTSGAEFTTSDIKFDYLSNGFKLREVNGAINASGSTYIYMAFAEVPYKFSNAR